MIKHAPEPEVVKRVVKKLDVDDDGYVVLEHVLDLIGEEGLGEYCHRRRDSFLIHLHQALSWMRMHKIYLDKEGRS